MVVRYLWSARKDFMDRDNRASMDEIHLRILRVTEDLRTIQEEWERIWFTDHPSHLTPNRVDGAIQ